ncbi:MAG: hypothetical protein GX772_10905 [Alcaligenaceae bacterium]|nr:hypothetical protein [Alcaligenaceae bacterium]
MNIIRSFVSRFIYHSIYACLFLSSMRNGLRSRGKKDVVHFSAPYAGQKILLLALYQKGRIRDDVLALLRAAKSLGVYVIGVNTLKLSAPDDYRDYLSCYIERFNFGRDFGSYKAGFSYIYSQEHAAHCPRLLMLNDSVFFSEKHVLKFLKEMLESDFEVLGATENHEVEYHLGSFCIAMSHAVLNSGKIREYWRNYKCSDVRPQVIKRGEMGLTKALRAAVASPDSIGALYDVTYAVNKLRSDPELFEAVATLSRCSPTFWPTFSFSEVSRALYGKYLHRKLPTDEIAEGDEDSVETVGLGALASGFKQVALGLEPGPVNEDGPLEELVNRKIISDFAASFSRGSQIHQNGPFLHRMGLAIIKIDGLYRGVFNSEDVEMIAEDLVPEQRDSFRRIMYARQPGDISYFGWKRSAFNRGLI